MSLIPKKQFMNGCIDSATYAELTVTLIGLDSDTVKEMYEIRTVCNLSVKYAILGQVHGQEYPLTCGDSIFRVTGSICYSNKQPVVIIHTDGKYL